MRYSLPFNPNLKCTSCHAFLTLETWLFANARCTHSYTEFPFLYQFHLIPFNRIRKLTAALFKFQTARVASHPSENQVPEKIISFSKTQHLALLTLHILCFGYNCLGTFDPYLRNETRISIDIAALSNEHTK